MSSAVLKLIAIITMLIDHVGLLFFPQHLIFRMVGRLSFPLFCFLLVQGFLHTKSRGKYLSMLFLFGVVSEIPYQLFIAGELRNPLMGSNVLFALALGIVAMMFLEMGERENNYWGIVPVFLCIGAQLLNLSYGAYGILLISLFYLFRRSRVLCALMLAACTAGYCIYHGSAIQAYGIFAGVLILFYNRQKGWNMPKYFFYGFYPGHMLALYLLHGLLIH